ncbi:MULTISPECIES: CRISPR-associated endoribonuclease Cas6 [unclassified Synechocystis]|uniref:CRISPR-associated endoribonuclease Cas6 n=1 Tax=unclassified Synechocystis TaxID=2640012 RepID=UPI0002E286B7|nr:MULTISPECIES: CRISPR-associated endoribonuclease Cas6 [unclassified Synechocystis]
MDLKSLAGAEMVGLRWQLRFDRPCRLESHYVKGLHAWFLHQVQAIDPDVSAWLHDGQGEKPFTISRLIGPTLWQEGHWHWQINKTYHWQLNLLSGALIEALQPWLARLPNKIVLARQTLWVEAVDCYLAPHNYQQLWPQGALPRRQEFTFTSPTSFRRQGNHYPLPEPRNVLQSYLRRWNDFSGLAFEPEPFLDYWVPQNVVIDRHWLESVKTTAGKQGSVVGFVGAVSLVLTPQARNDGDDYGRLFHALCRYGPYCGTGHKTTFGLGQTMAGWATPDLKTFACLQEDLQTQVLTQRIDQCASLLLAQRQRTGGQRAQEICHTLATIFVRREQGESLQEIALDLQLPYETARTYSKRAKRALANVQ